MRNIPFDGDWRFHLGDPGHAQDARFDDSGWRSLSLPHDWSIEDRLGAPKTADPWVPPLALWNTGDHPDDAQPVSPEVPIVMASVHPSTPGGPPRKVGPFDADQTAFGWGTGWTVGGTGWYRKRFSLTDLAPGEQVEIRFDGAFLITDVWLNGVWLGRNVNGYLGYVFDLTPHLRKDGLNVLAVRVANEGETARWYSGSGLYRHVWLNRTGMVRMRDSGLAITTMSANPSEAIVEFVIEIENRSNDAAAVDCEISIPGAHGGATIRATQILNLAAQSQGPIKLVVNVKSPALWSPDSPALYVAEITLKSGGRIADRFNARFGIRTLHVSSERGLEINGKAYPIQGACLHHDNGIIGAVAIDRAERRKVELVKSSGFNAIRCSHNPPSPYFLDVCDELGMIVMDEAFDVWEAPKLLKDAYDQHFAENWRKDLAAMVRRDRIHPSIVFWSIGNEISEAVTPRGVELAGQMCEVIREHDRSRFISHALTATHSGAAGEGARAPLDTISYNYSFDAVDRDHRAYPSLTFMNTETHAADAYVVKQLMDRNRAYLGEFLWTGLDYIGEVGSGSSRLRSDTAQPDAKPKMIFGMDVSHLNFYVWDYPAYQSGSGEIDLIGLKKPPSYFRDVVWGRSDLELFVQRPTPAGYHEEQTAWGWPDELMSWTWPDYPDETMTVRVVTRGDEVLLMLNGAEIGRKRLGPEDKRIAVFKTPYRTGALTAVAFVEGQEIARKTLESAGAPVQLRLRAERSTIAGSANDLAYVFVEVCDAQGRLVPDASVPVTFSSSKGLTLLAAGSANPYGIESFQDADTRTFHGTALAILQPSGLSGDATVSASSDGLESASLTVQFSPEV